LNPQSTGVVITTYNSPILLGKVLTGYESQSLKNFRVIVADDGSTDKTRVLVENFRARNILNIDHAWHEDERFRKCQILNKAIAETTCGYLIFTDGDCIPAPDFIETHQALASPSTFLSGGYIKLMNRLTPAAADYPLTYRSKASICDANSQTITQKKVCFYPLAIRSQSKEFYLKKP
jgi:glycosyltransferase involved in cell wall biosynthesis